MLPCPPNGPSCWGPVGQFFGLADTLLDEYRYGNISTQEFIAEAKKASGFKGAKLSKLDRYFRQWLYGTTKPTILPEDFA